MKNFQRLIPAVAILISLPALAASAASYPVISHLNMNHSWNTESQMMAANAKGRPAEFAPLKAQDVDVEFVYSAATPPNKDGAPIPNGD